jgi:hypothetical protein
VVVNEVDSREESAVDGRNSLKCIRKHEKSRITAKRGERVEGGNLQVPYVVADAQLCGCSSC